MKGWLRTAGLVAGASLGLCASAFAAGGPSVPPHAPDPAPPGLVEAAPDAAFEPGQVIVRFRDGVDQPGRIRTLDGARVHFRKALPLRGAQLVTVPAGGTVAATVAALRRDPRVEYAQPNYLRRLAQAPADRWFPQQWALQNTGQNAGGIVGTPGADVRATSAWDVTTGSPAIKIAVVDTGINASSPDFAGRLVGGQDFVPAVPDSDPTDPSFHSHGTWVSGIIAANADAAGMGSGMTGVDWQAKIMPLRVFDERGLTTTDRIVSAYNWAATNGAKIVNASFSGAAFSQPEFDAIAAHPDVLFVAAAGNANADLELKAQTDTTIPAYPCAYKLENVLCVAATDQNDQRATFSNYGQKSVDVAAPGYNVLTTSVKPGDQIYPAPPAGVDTFSTFGNWVADQASGKNHPVDWGVETAAPFANSLSDSPATVYSNGTDTAAVTATALDLSGRSACHVTYDLNMLLDTHSGSQDAFSIDTIRSPLTPAFGDAWTTESSLSGTTGGTIAGRTTELASINGAQSAWLRFKLHTDAQFNADGVHLDNVSVSCGAPAGLYSGAADEYLFVDGTSFAAPVVTGIASLVLSVDPSMGPVAVKDRIIATSDFKPLLANLTVSDGRVNADAAVRMAPGIVGGGQSSLLGDTSARVTTSVRSRGQASAVFVDYGTDTSYGATVAAGTLSAATTSAQGAGAVLTGLTRGTTYHYRWRAQNPTGVPSAVDVGPDQTFTTPGAVIGGNPGPVTPPPTSTPKPKPKPKPACSGLKGAKLAACKRRQALKKAVASCNSHFKGAKNAKKRAVCIRKARAVSACQVKKGKAKAVCLAKARRIK